MPKLSDAGVLNRNLWRHSFCLLFFVFALLALTAGDSQAQLFGDGSDGDVTISSAVSLTADMNYNNLTVTAAGVLTTNGHQVNVNGTLNNMGVITSGLVTNYGTGGSGGNRGFGIHTPPTSGNPGNSGFAGPAGSGIGGHGGGGGGGGGGAWDAGAGQFANGGFGGTGGRGGRGALAMKINARNLNSTGIIGANGEPGQQGSNGSTGSYDSWTELLVFDYDQAGGGGGGGGGGQGGAGGDVTVYYSSLISAGTIQSLGGSGASGRPGGNSINTIESAGSGQNEESGRPGGSGAGLGGSGGSGGRSEISSAASSGGNPGGGGVSGAGGVVTVSQSVVCYQDTDGDGYGNPAISGDFATSCPAGWVSDNTDCNDANFNINPGRPEVLCDGVDDDCNPATPDDHNFDGDPVSSCNGDCDDNDPNRYPGNIETCDNVDNDCNGQVDDGLTFVTYYQDSDGDGFGNALVSATTCDGAPAGYVNNDLDCDDTNGSRFPGNPEVCDGIDNDCNSIVDDGLTFLTYYEDSDGDNYGNAGVFAQTCDGAPSGYVSDNTDCDDTNPGINPGATEIPNNSIDEDCDGVDACCVAIRGDCNGDGTDANILDLNFLVNRVFRGGPPPACFEEGDVNTDGFSANIIDLNFMVNKVFRGGPLPGPC